MRFVVDLSSVQLGDVSKLTRIPLAMLGRWVKGNQKFAITRETVKALVENLRKRKADVVIDYEHASEFPELAKGGPVPAAGWLKQVEDGPDDRGVLWGLAELTQRAREMIERAEYKYISPAIHWGARDKVSGEPQGATLTSVALVNRPFLDAMPSVQLSEAGGQILEDEVSMKATTLRLAEGENQGKVIVTCGECGKETSAEALKAPEPKVVRLSDVKRADDGRFDFRAVQAEGETLVAGEVLHAMNVQTELDAAVKEGKILPAQRKHYETLALSDLDGFRELVKSMKPQVELSERGFAGGTDGTGGGDLQKLDKQLSQLAREKMQADKDLTYGQAFKTVLSERPDLKKWRAELMRD